MLTKDEDEFEGSGVGVATAPSVEDLIQSHVGTIRKRNIEIMAHFITKLASCEAEKKAVYEKLEEILQERNLYKRLWLSERKKSETSSALLAKALDKLDANLMHVVRDRIFVQDLIVKYAETQQTLTAMTSVIDQLRGMIRSYVPKTDLQRFEETLDSLMNLVDRLMEGKAIEKIIASRKIPGEQK